jgi:hypothetical protein
MYKQLINKLFTRKSNTKKSNTKKTNSKKTNSKKSNSKKSNSKKSNIPDEILKYNLQNFLDVKSKHNLSQVNKKNRNNLYDTLLSLKIKKELKNAIIINSDEINEIVEQYYWKTYKKGKKYEEIHETSLKRYEEFTELYDEEISYYIENFASFVKNKLNYNYLPDIIKDDIKDQKLTIIILQDRDEIYYNKELLDKSSELYNMIIRFH